MTARIGLGADCGNNGKVIIVMQTARTLLMRPRFLSREEINKRIEKRFGKKLENTPLAIAIIDLANQGLLKKKKLTPPAKSKFGFRSIKNNG